MLWCSYTKNSKDVIVQLDELNAFEKIYKAVEASIGAHKDISGSDIASMYGGLIQFAEAVYPDRLVYVDNILEQAVKVIGCLCSWSFYSSIVIIFYSKQHMTWTCRFWRQRHHFMMRRLKRKF